MSGHGKELCAPSTKVKLNMVGLPAVRNCRVVSGGMEAPTREQKAFQNPEILTGTHVDK